MNKMLLGAVCAILSFAGLGGEALQAQRLNGSIYLDGKLDEPAWQKAPVYTRFFKAGTQTPARSRTEVRILFDLNALYVGIRCSEPAIHELVVRDTPRDGGLYQQDCLEIMLDPGVSKERYYHFMVNAAGQQYDAFREQGGGIQNPFWNGVWTAKTFIGKDFWSCEIRIPFFNFSSRDASSGDWGINVCRGQRTNPREDSSFSGEYHKMDKFLTVKGIQTDMTPYRLDVENPSGKIRLGGGERIFVENSAAVGNFSGKERTLLADCWLTAPDGQVYTSPQTRFTLKNGETKTVVLPKAEIRKQGKYLNSLRITDLSGKTLAYRDVIQNILFSPISIRLSVPWYRHSIFESQKIKTVEFAVQLAMEPAMLKNKSLEISIGNAEQTVWSKTVRPVLPIQQFSVPNAEIPHGRYTIQAVLKDENGKKMDFCEAAQPLWKLPFKASEVWKGQDGRWFIAGKPVFINSLWTSGYGEKFYNTPAHNMLMTYHDKWKNLNPGVYAISANAIFGILKKPGVLKGLQSGSLDKKELDLYRESVRADRNAPNLFCYYLADEPSSLSIHPDALVQVYETMKEEDPWHPVMLSDSPRNEYILACDINVHHPYPNTLRSVKANDCTPIVSALDSGKVKLGSGYHQTSFIFMDMGFNKFDFGLGDKDGRIATFDEFRDHMLMGLAAGMKGLMPFISSSTCYPECVIGFPALAREGAWLGEAVIGPDTPFRPKADFDKVRFISKDRQGDTVIIASNVSMNARKVVFSGLPANIRKVNVIGEGRSIEVKDGAFADFFKECQGHAYTTGKLPELPTEAEVNAQIEAAWRKLAKPGNLLFQRYKDDTVHITASSAFVNFSNGGAESALWHLCDGDTRPEKGYFLQFWSSIPGKLPAWILFEPKKTPLTVGRIVLYPYEQSVKGINVEIFANGQWKKVYENADASGLDRIEAVFPPEKITKFRINVLSAAPPKRKLRDKEVVRARIVEVEAYGK